MKIYRVNCWKPEMAISSQAPQECGEGSETRLYVPIGLYVNLSVESKGYESPRARGNQAMQEMWSEKGYLGILREKSFKAMQAMPTRKIASELPKEQIGSFEAMRGIPKAKRFTDQTVFA